LERGCVYDLLYVCVTVRSCRRCPAERRHVHAAGASPSSLGRRSTLRLHGRRQHRMALRPTTHRRRQRRHRVAQVSSSAHLLTVDFYTVLKVMSHRRGLRLTSVARELGGEGLLFYTILTVSWLCCGEAKH